MGEERKIEQLVEQISSGDEAAYPELLDRLAPITLHEAQMYLGKMSDLYGRDDFLQEGAIVAWEIISRGTYRTDSCTKFTTYFGAAVRRRFCRLWRDYTLKNLVCIGESEDCRGNRTRILVESDYARTYREKQAASQKRWAEKRRAEQPPKEKRVALTAAERSARSVAYQKEYYASHPDKLAERWEKNRIAARERLARKKAAASSAQA